MDESALRATLEKELHEFPAALGQEFAKALPLVAQRLTTEEALLWAQEGLALARQSFRSWEAAAEYFKASPRILPSLEFPHFVFWVQEGKHLNQDSSSLAQAYFRASPAALSYLTPFQMGEWAKLGRGLYKGTWRSNALSCRFFETSPKLFRCLSLRESGAFVAFLEALASRSYDLALECLNLSEEVFIAVEKQDRGAFLNLATVLLDTHWSDARAYFEIGPKLLSRLERGSRPRFLALAEKVARSNARGTLPFLTETSRALGQLDANLHTHLLQRAEELLPYSWAAVGEFLKSCPLVLRRIRTPNLDRWYSEGLRILKENEVAGLAYFSLESNKGEGILEGLSCGVELDRVKEIIRMYCKALSAVDVQILPTQYLKDKGIGWTSLEKPTTEGLAIFLPPLVERYVSKGENFAWYKVMATHQAAHLEFDSFVFSFGREAALFPNMRHKLAARKESANATATDLEKFFDLFPDRKLASHIFTVVEDSRVDYRVKHEYSGIRRSYQRVQKEALEKRRPLTSLPLREAVLECLIRLSLGGGQELTIPAQARQQLVKALGVMRRVEVAEATVEDSAEATIHLYHLLIEIANRLRPPEEWEPITSEEEVPEGEEEELELSLDAQASQMGKEGELPYQPPQDVEFRGDFKPELVQLLSRLRDGAKEQRGAGMPLSLEQIRQLLEKNAEIEISQLYQGDLLKSTGLFVSNLMEEATRKPLPKPPLSTLARSSAGDGNKESLEDEPLSVLYDEWDFRAGDYKPRWCRVREKKMEEGSIEFFEKTLETHSSLVAQIRKQFECITPELFRKIKRLPDGEDFELDAVIEAIVERKAGTTPSEKLYWRRNKVERDVSVVFLLDMSASTAEAIEERRKGDDFFPDDPSQYLAWLKARRAEEAKREYKRIIDIERESLALLIGALETTGDTYGIYGFSGYGRENVEFYVLKDLEENFTDKVKRRLDKITPLHATRMGPAIRHATAKLDVQFSKTKILFLISDGRPQDHGYSRDGMEKEYAIHDTRMALVEAKRKNIVPFCLTVDRAGHDYLKTMCEDMAYEVLADIQALPKRLPLLYRRLTQ